MKSRFLNKTKKYTGPFLVFVFAFSLFFSSINVKTAEGTHALLAPQLKLNMDASEIGFLNAGMLTDQTEATANQISQNWWQTAIKWVNDKAYQIQDAIFQKSEIIKEYVLDPMAWTMANVIIDKFGDAIVDWIRNGFEGSPMFLSDPEGFFRDTANAASGAIINDLDMQWLCNPLGKLRLNIDFFFPGTNRVKYKCTFNDIAANFKNISGRKDISDWVDFNANFHEKNIVTTFGNDYRNGGFLMWLFTAQKKNNDLGRTIQTASDAYIAASVNVGSEKFSLNLNAGFFGVKKCVEYESIPLEDGGLRTTSKCLKYETKTPGQLVQDQLKDVAGKDLSRLQVADEVNEIIGALASTMMGWLLTGGNDGGGVLGYDKGASYSGSNRNHFGNLEKNKKIVAKKTSILEQVTKIKSNEEQYSNLFGKHADILFGTKEKLEIILAKLKCVRTASANDIDNIYPDSDCDGADEKTKNILLSATGKTQANITSDIGKTESQISDVDGKISIFAGKYGGMSAATTSTQALKLFDEFESKVMSAIDLDEINTVKEEYCYSYDETSGTGEICGFLGSDEIYKTHNNEKSYQPLNEDIEKTKSKMDIIIRKYVCVLNGYTQSEGVSKQECASSLFFKRKEPSSSPSPSLSESSESSESSE